jgi:hypothetical protein
LNLGEKIIVIPLPKIELLLNAGLHLILFIFIYVYGKGKAIPLQTCTCPEVSRRLRLPDFKTFSTGGCQAYTPAAFTPRNYSWYSFLLEAESTPGP